MTATLRVLVLLGTFTTAIASGPRSFAQKLDPLPMPQPRTGPPPKVVNVPVCYDLRTKQEYARPWAPPDPRPAAHEPGRRGVSPQAPSLLNFSDLTMISNPEDYPYCVNVKLRVYFPGGSGEASGALIDPKHVLTAGHCVHFNTYGGWANSITVIPGYENGNEPYGYAHAVTLSSFSPWISGEDDNWDMGLIELDRPIGALTGWYGYGYDSDNSFFTGSTFYNRNYPGEAPYDGEYMYSWHGTYDQAFADMLYFYKDSYGGQSGSCSYHVQGDDRIVYAEHSNGMWWPEIKAGHVRMTSTKFTQIRDTWIDDHTPSGEDFIPLDVRAPSTVTAGHQLASFSVLVHNYSENSWSGSLTYKVYMAHNSSPDSGDTQVGDYSWSGSIGARDSVRITPATPPTIPADERGTVWLGVVVTESDADPSNNTTHQCDAAEVDVAENMETRLTVQDVVGEIGETVTLSATLRRVSNNVALPGQTVTFSVDGSDVGTDTTVRGIASIAYQIQPALGVGDVQIGAMYAGNGTYEGCAGTGTLTVEKGLTSIDLTDPSGAIGETVTLHAVLTRTVGAMRLGGREVHFWVDGTEIGTDVTTKAGIAELDYWIPPELGTGAHQAAAEFEGDSLYAGSLDIAPFSISQATTTMTVADAVGTIGETVPLSARLTRDSDGAWIEGRTVQFTIDAVAIGSDATNRFGLATVDYVIPQALGIGAKPVGAEFAGDAEHAGSSGAGTLSVVYPTALAVPNVAGPVFSTVTLSATLTRATDGAPLPGQTVSFAVLYTPIGSGVTDASGLATCTFTIPSNIGDGPKPIRAVFESTGDYAGCTGNGVLTVSKVASTIQVLDRTGIITEQVLLRAYLRRQSDNAPIGSRLVKFRVDGGAVGAATTDANGRATLPYVIPPAGGPGLRQITAIFAGDEDYLPCFGSGTLTAQRVATKMFGQDRTCRITDYTILKAYLFRMDNTPIIGREIGFMVDGTGVGAANTNPQGRAQLGYVVADGAGAGDRPIVANWAGDPGYMANTCTNTLTALKTFPYIWVLPKKAPLGSMVSLYAYFRRLYDYQPQPGKDVTFLIDGTSVWTMQTGPNGVASFPYQSVEPIGPHTVRCDFAGDAWLEPGFGEGGLTIY